MLQSAIPTTKFLLEFEKMQNKLEIPDILEQLRTFQKDMSTIEEVELAECIILCYFSDRARKEGGGKGSVGNVKDELNREKYDNVAEETQ